MPAKRAISLIMLALLLVQPLGPLLLFSVQRQQAKREIKQRLKAAAKEEDLIRLTIPLALERGSNTRFLRIDDREFRLDGKMYDIIRQEVRGDTTYYVCIEDVKETVLFAGLEALIRNDINHEGQKKAASARLSRLVQSQFLRMDVPDTFIMESRGRPRLATEPRPLYRPDAPPSPPPEAGLKIRIV